MYIWIYSVWQNKVKFYVITLGVEAWEGDLVIFLLFFLPEEELPVLINLIRSSSFALLPSSGSSNSNTAMALLDLIWFVSTFNLGMFGLVAPGGAYNLLDNLPGAA